MCETHFLSNETVLDLNVAGYLQESYFPKNPGNI